MAYRGVGAALIGLLVAATSAAAPPAPETPTAATLELRRHFMDRSVNALTFHSIDAIFETRAVKRATMPIAIPRAERPLAFSYTYAGQTHAGEDVLERTFTNALLVIKNGRIVYERYRNHSGPDTRFLSMSMAKSITSLLIGAAIEDGSIGSLDDQIVRYVPELKGSAYDGVTICDAIDMKSGVDRADGDQLKPGGTGARMREEILVRNLRSPAQEALFVRRKEAPGRRFDYSTLNTSVLGWVLEKATHRRLDDYTAAKLWTRLGTDSDGSWIVSGTAPDAGVFNGMGFNATLRDYGRLGMMMLNHGRVAGRQVVPARWVDESVAAPHLPTSVGAMHGYNHFWWLVPDSAAYMAIGLQGQYIYVDPTTRTVIVKLSYVPLDDHAAGAEAEAFFAAASRWRPRPV